MVEKTPNTTAKATMSSALWASSSTEAITSEFRLLQIESVIEELVLECGTLSKVKSHSFLQCHFTFANMNIHY